MPKTYQPKQLRRTRKLPYWQTPDGVYAILFRLKGSLPKGVVERLRSERKEAEKQLLESGLSQDEVEIKIRQMRQFYFGKFDDLLDNSTTGPHFLKDPALAKIVEDAILHFDGDRYKIITYTIMSNHVHLVFYKLQKEIEDILESMKQYSATQINKVQGCPGRTVWTPGAYNHIIRGRSELTNWVSYTLNNARKAGLVKCWEEFPHSYLKEGYENFYASLYDRFS